MEQALYWIFAGDDSPVSFETCCIALDARMEPLQLRLQYEWYLRWQVFPAPLPIESTGVPTGIQNEILFVAGTDGLRVATDIWFNPGITRNSILRNAERLSVFGAAKALDLLDEQNLVRNRAELDPTGQGNWYLTGRRPSRKEVPRGMI